MKWERKVQVKQRHHGGIEQYLLEQPRESEITPASAAQPVIDFSVNINPYGPSSKVRSAIHNSCFQSYPEPQAESLKGRLSEQYHCQKQQGIIVGNGAADLMWTYCHTQIKAGSRVLILEPTFSEFRFACEQLQARIWEWRARAENSFQWDYQEIESLIQKEKIQHLYVCHPNSPTGSAVDIKWLSKLAEKKPELSIILDLAFINLSPLYEDSHRQLPLNVIKLYSLTKDHSIPGLRLGFAIAAQSLIQKMENQRASWSVNSLAIAAGMAATEEADFIHSCRQRILQDQEYLVKILQQHGLSFHSAHAPMILIDTGNGRQTQKKLWMENILVRDCSSYGLEQWIRIFPRPAADADKFLAALLKQL